MVKISQEFKPAQPQLSWSEQPGEHSSAEAAVTESSHNDIPSA